MTEKKIIAVPMEFDGDLLRRDVRTMLQHCNLTRRDVDNLMGVQVVDNLLNGRRRDYMPTLRNFILLCNVLDLDPRRYFKLATLWDNDVSDARPNGT